MSNARPLTARHSGTPTVQLQTLRHAQRGLAVRGASIQITIPITADATAMRTRASVISGWQSPVAPPETTISTKQVDCGTDAGTQGQRAIAIVGVEVMFSSRLVITVMTVAITATRASLSA